MNSNSLEIGQGKKRILLHLPNPLEPIDSGSKRRIFGFLNYFNSRKEIFIVDIVSDNTFQNPRWSTEQQDFLRGLVNHLYVYRGEHNLLDFIYSRAKSLCYQKLLKQQLPVDSDYFTPPGYCRFVRSLLVNGSYDIFWLNYLDYAHLATTFKGNSGCIILDIHDLACELRVARQGLKYLHGLNFNYSANFKKEIASLSKFDAVLINSQREMATVSSEIGTSKLHLIPHLVQDLSIAPVPVYQDRNFSYDILFVGTAYQPNIDGLNFFLTSIFEKIIFHQPNVRFAIAGNVGKAIKFRDSFQKNIFCLGFVSDLSEIYLKTKVVLCPLLNGSGTNVKIQEAMAYSLPIVCTSVGATGLELYDGVNSIIADDPERYAQGILSLLEDANFAQAMSSQVTLTFEEYYSNQAIFAKLDQLLAK